MEETCLGHVLHCKMHWMLMVFIVVVEWFLP